MQITTHKTVRKSLCNEHYQDLPPPISLLQVDCQHLLGIEHWLRLVDVHTNRDNNSLNTCLLPPLPHKKV